MKRIVSLLVLGALLAGSVLLLASCGAAKKNVTVVVKDPAGIAVVNASGATEKDNAKDALAAFGYIHVGEDGGITVNAAGCTEAAVTLKINGEDAEWDAKIADGDELLLLCR